MESVFWNLRTLNGFSVFAPLFAGAAVHAAGVLGLPAAAAVSCSRREPLARPGASPGKALSTLVVIPSLLRVEEELRSMQSTVESVASNGYPGHLLIVLSIDGTAAAPALYAQLEAWGQSRRWNDHTWLYVTGTADRRSKPMAIDHAMEFVKRPGARRASTPPSRGVCEHGCRRGSRPAFARSASYIACNQRNPFTGAPARAVAAACTCAATTSGAGWRHFFTVSGQLNLQVARDYYVSNVGRYNLRWLP
jgi:hypothetical protein